MQGMSSSLPEEVQRRVYATVPGLEHAKVMRPAYAIEYDCINANLLKLTLETRDVDGLFCADADYHRVEGALLHLAGKAGIYDKKNHDMDD